MLVGKDEIVEGMSRFFLQLNSCTFVCPRVAPRLLSASVHSLGARARNYLFSFGVRLHSTTFAVCSPTTKITKGFLMGRYFRHPQPPAFVVVLERGSGVSNVLVPPRP